MRPQIQPGTQNRDGGEWKDKKRIRGREYLFWEFENLSDGTKGNTATPFSSVMGPRSQTLSPFLFYFHSYSSFLDHLYTLTSYPTSFHIAHAYSASTTYPAAQAHQTRQLKPPPPGLSHTIFSMSLTSNFSLPQSFSVDANDHSISSIPSPPSLSSGRTSPDFDFESFTHYSPNPSPLVDETDSTELHKEFSSTPSSTDLVSPRSSIADISQIQPPTQVEEVETAEALSTHHLQRYLHYKALAARAEADRAIVIHQQAQSHSPDDDFGALFAACDKSSVLLMPDASANSTFFKDTVVSGDSHNNMLAYQSQMLQPTYYQMGQAMPNWQQSDGFYHPQPSHAALHNAQAQAHLQAAEAARFQAEQHRMNMSNFYVPVSAGPRSSYDATSQNAPSFAGQSVSNLTNQSPSYSSTRSYPVASNIVMDKTSSMSGLTTCASSRRASEEGEEELAYTSEEEDVKPILGSIPIVNVHGGGRGYVPGQTPDDPKKKHKCQVCGRGFARAFNLKVSKHLLP